MKSVRVFLASSSELAADRAVFETFLSRKSKLWKTKNTQFELVNWEDFVDAVSKTRLQDEYNKAIVACDLFVVLFHTKVGMYTAEEFETALAAFQKNGTPLIYTYQKDDEPGDPKQESVGLFIEKLKALGHFQTVYKNTEGLLLHFGAQLDKLYSMDQPTAKTPKEEIISMINKGNLADALEELNNHFLGKNDSLNVLMDDFINPDNNFNKKDFMGQLKLFISRNW